MNWTNTKELIYFVDSNKPLYNLITRNKDNFNLFVKDVYLCVYALLELRNIKINFDKLSLSKLYNYYCS